MIDVLRAVIGVLRAVIGVLRAVIGVLRAVIDVLPVRRCTPCRCATPHTGGVESLVADGGAVGD